MPVLPLVGSISALPGLRRPRFSASHTIDAPMRSFTEKAGLRPSTFARTTARAPLTTRFRRTSGVRPRLYELSSKTANSNLPVQHEPVLSLGPARHELGKSRAVDNGGDRAVDIVPHGGKGRVGFPPLAGAALHRPFHVTENVPHRDRLRRTSQQVSAFGAATRFDEPALLEAGQDQFQKLLRNALPPCNFRDLDRLARRLRREIEDGLQGVFAFDGDVQTEIVRQGGGWRIIGGGIGAGAFLPPGPNPRCSELETKSEGHAPVVGRRSAAATARPAAEAGADRGRLQEKRIGDDALITTGVEVVQEILELGAQRHVEAVLGAAAPEAAETAAAAAAHAHTAAGTAGAATAAARAAAGTAEAAGPTTGAAAVTRLGAVAGDRAEAEHAVDAQVHREQARHREIVAGHQVAQIRGAHIACEHTVGRAHGIARADHIVTGESGTGGSGRRQTRAHVG